RPRAEPTEPAAPIQPETDGLHASATDWSTVMANAQAAFPEALPRRLTLPQKPGAPLTLRMKQSFEWTPNGRTYVYLDPATGTVLATDDPATGDTASAITEKYYPVHAGKVGGVAWRLVLTCSGLALVLLGTLATWSSWFGSKRRKSRKRPRAAAARALVPRQADLPGRRGPIARRRISRYGWRAPAEPAPEPVRSQGDFHPLPCRRARHPGHLGDRLARDGHQCRDRTDRSRRHVDR